jgi:hypothetical protein
VNSCSAGQQGFRGCITQGALEGTQRWAGCLLGGDCPWALEARCAAEKRACLFQRIGPTLTAAAAPVKAHSCTHPLHIVSPGLAEAGCVATQE